MVSLPAAGGSRGCGVTGDENSILLAVQHARLRQEQAEAVRRALRDADPVERLRMLPRGAAGDAARLRALPCVGKGGLPGTIPGTDPLRAVLAKEARREARRG